MNTIKCAKCSSQHNVTYYNIGSINILLCKECFSYYHDEHNMVTINCAIQITDGDGLVSGDACVECKRYLSNVKRENEYLGGTEKQPQRSSVLFDTIKRMRSFAF